MAIYWTTDGHVTPEQSLANPGHARLPSDAASPQENTRSERRQPIQPMTRTTTGCGVPFVNCTTDNQKAIVWAVDWAVDRRVKTAARRH